MVLFANTMRTLIFMYILQYVSSASQSDCVSNTRFDAISGNCIACPPSETSLPNSNTCVDVWGGDIFQFGTDSIVNENDGGNGDSSIFSVIIFTMFVISSIVAWSCIFVRLCCIRVEGNTHFKKYTTNNFLGNPIY